MSDTKEVSRVERVDLDSTYGSMISSISDSLVRVGEMTRIVVESFEQMIDTMRSIAQAIAEALPSNFLQGLVEVIQEIYNNPDSYFNYAKYEKQLDNFHWAWPYDFTADEIKTLVETVEDERGFDKCMIGIFSSGKDSRLMEEILAELPKRHRVIFKQIMKAYNQGDYVITNNALMSIIDNLLAEYLYNPGQVRRNGLFKPIVNLWSTMLYDTATTFRMMMLAHNIDFIFEEYDFAEKIVIETNKKARRHPSVHGFKYSNQKVDSLMLMNTLWELLLLKGDLKPFKRSLRMDKKTREFVVIDAKYRMVFRTLTKQLVIGSLRESEGELSHGEILEEIKFALNNDAIVTPKYISSILQLLKKQGLIYSIRKNGKTKWALKSTQE